MIPKGETKIQFHGKTFALKPQKNAELLSIEIYPIYGTLAVPQCLNNCSTHIIPIVDW